MNEYFADGWRRTLRLTYFGLCLAVMASDTSCATRQTSKAVEDPPVQSVCFTSANAAKVSIIDWEATSRVDIEHVRLRGPVAVHYDGCSRPEVVAGCSLEGSYSFRAVPVQRERVEIRTRKELYEALPFVAAKYESRLSQGDRIMGDLVAVAKGVAVGVAKLDTEDCAQATHYVYGLTIGAFSFHSEMSARSGASVAVLTATKDQSAESEKRTLSSGGDRDACGRPGSTSIGDSGRCGAVIGIELRPITSVQTWSPRRPAGPRSKIAAADCPPGMNFVPPGEYVFKFEPSAPQTTGVEEFDVDYKGWCLDVLEVTARQYRRCVEAGRCSPPTDSDASDPQCNWSRSDRGDHPMNCLESDDAGRYCEWLGKRLPTDFEWEAAARGAKQQPYPWGDKDPSGKLCWKRTPAEGTCAVGGHPQGASPFGILDMSGNVAEWTLSGDYDPTLNLWLRHSVRGGSWLETDEKQIRTDTIARSACGQSTIGFRCLWPAKR